MYLPFSLHQEKLRELVKKREIIAQELVSDVKDNKGHFGELRVFSFIR